MNEKSTGSKPKQTRQKVSRLYKKCSTDGDLTIFLPKRELEMDGETGQIGNLEGIVIISESLAKKDKVNVFIQFSLELRYGREDEELMGLQFCNEMIIANQRIYPVDPEQEKNLVPHQDLREKYECLAVPFSINVGSCLPPTVRLKPTRSYTGSPIGTSYTVSVYPTESATDKRPPSKSSVICMAVWLSETLPQLQEIRPRVTIHKPCNRIRNEEIKIQGILDKNVYQNGDTVKVDITIELHPARKIKSVTAIAVQSVDVAMFSSGFFKNEVGAEMLKDLGVCSSFSHQFLLKPQYSPGRHWVAVKDWGPSVTSIPDENQPLSASVILKDRSLFVIRVLYYVQVQVRLSKNRKDLELKLPFVMLAA